MITCQFEDGAQGRLRHVTVATIATNQNNQVLLVRRAPHLTRGGKFTIPGGFVDRDETIAQAGLRELAEETGYSAEIVSLFYVNDNPDRPREDRQNSDFIYVVRITGGDRALSEETSEVTWVSLSELPPDEDFAFDHRGLILLYADYLRSRFALPAFPAQNPLPAA
jgi:8-oxo-dGTP diphosphatase